MEANMAKKKLFKAGDRTILVDKYGDGSAEIKNRILSDEATLALELICRWGMVASHTKDGAALPAGAVVERAFDIAKLAYQHIKANRLDTAFPFGKVYPDDQENG
jgi:hypothetical protein